ncbi:MAG: GNAT family N-acetyltransferase [Sandaracinaceae bacterium]
MPFASLAPEDVYAMLALRAAIFVVEQRCAYLDPDGRDLDAWHVLGRDRAGVLGAYARVMPADEPGAAHRIGRVVVHAALRGGGEGKRLMREALAVCDHLGAAPVELAAQAHLTGFYQGLGFSVISGPYDEDGIPHLDMRAPAPPR